MAGFALMGGRECITFKSTTKFDNDVVRDSLSTS